MVTSSFRLYCRSSHHYHSVSFLSRVKRNSINWPALIFVWVVIAQLVEHCVRTQRPRVRIPLKHQKSFFFFFLVGWGLIRECLNCDYNCDGHIFISFVFPQFTSFSFYISQSVKLVCFVYCLPVLVNTCRL